MYGVLLRRNIFLREYEDTEMIALAEELKGKGVQLFLLSNIFVRKSSYFKKRFGFIKFFNKLYFSSDTGFIKPDPRAFELVLKENNLKPEDCVFFDDSEANVAAAQALGIEAYVFVGADAARQAILRS